MKLHGDWLEAAGTQAVLGMLEQAGYQAYVVGGCVRNALLNQPVADIDISTAATPDEVTKLAKAAGFSPVPTGIEHGTITVVIDGEPHEVTTFRKDVETDGRRAVVAFSDDIRDDAHRRDFTFNALYAAADGTLVDPLGGLPDLKARRVRFIENASQRIREDYLRILRFFRFYAWYGDAEAGPDDAAIDACARLADGLGRLSKERIGTEMRKLLSAPNPAPAIALMAATGTLQHVLSGADPRFLAPVVHLEEQAALEPRWQRRLRVLGSEDWSESLRLSRKEQRELTDLDCALTQSMSPGEAAYRYGGDVATDAVLIVAASLGARPPDDWTDSVARGLRAKFPIAAVDLMDRYGPGPDLGQALKRLEKAWVASGFNVSQADLLAIDLEQKL